MCVWPHLVAGADGEVLHRGDEPLGDELAVGGGRLSPQKLSLHSGQLGLERPEEREREQLG